MKDKLKVKAEEILRKKIKPQGNSGHIYLPRRYVGQECVVIIVPKPEKVVHITLEKKGSHKPSMEV